MKYFCDCLESPNYNESRASRTPVIHNSSKLLDPEHTRPSSCTSSALTFPPVQAYSSSCTSLDCLLYKLRPSSFRLYSKYSMTIVRKEHLIKLERLLKFKTMTEEGPLYSNPEPLERHQGPFPLPSPLQLPRSPRTRWSKGEEDSIQRAHGDDDSFHLPPDPKSVASEIASNKLLLHNATRLMHYASLYRRKYIRRIIFWPL